VTQSYLSVALLTLLAGAGLARAQAEPAPKGLVIVVGGVGGYDTLPLSARMTFPHAGVPHEVYNFVWTHRVGQLFRDLQDTEHVIRKSHELADLIRQRKESAPDQPIYLVAKSGGAGLALLAAEQLPPATLERIILLSPAVSPTYDLRPALRATRKELVNFYSKNDQFILHWGTCTFGNIDRHYGPGAGMTGFQVTVQTPEEAELFGRLVQVPWQPRMLLHGYAGGHHGTSAPPFLAAEVAPWLKE
jgi:hypothetical protein